MKKHSDILGTLFGSASRVKLLKFFLLNPGEGFSMDDVCERLRLKSANIRGELSDMQKAGFIKPKVVTKTVVGARSTRKKKFNGFIANGDFVLRDALRELLIESGGVHVADLPTRFASAGKINLLVVSGFFMHDSDRLMDMMIVGDRLDRKAAESEIKKIESEIGKELKYALFDTEEFMYRLKMYDKLIRDMFDYPHKKVVSKIDHPELRA